MLRKQPFQLLFLLPALSLFGQSLSGQDAGMALSTLVSYRTQRASLQLTGDQAKTADLMAEEAQKETQASHYDEAMRRYEHGFAAMHGVDWTPAVELVSSFQAKLNHALAAPGDQIAVSLVPLYVTERAASEKVRASVVLVPTRKEGPPEKTLTPSGEINLPFIATVAVPPAPEGDYTLQVRMTLADGTSPDGLRAAFVKSLPVHIEALSAEAEKLRIRLAAVQKDSPALPSAQYVLAHYEQADRGEVSPARYNFRGEIASANAILDSLDAGRDPFAGKQGDLRKAYLSNVDHTLQPYRLFIPSQYDGTKPVPLVVALHGMGGDENSMFEGYQEALKPQAQRVGFIIVCPKGRDPASMYRGTAEQDVLDTLAQVRRDYRIDSNRIYLMGHSMGGYGTWSIAIAHPEIFAALGPISGGGNTAAMDKIKNIPQYVTHGDDDRTVNVSQSRAMVAAGRKLNAPITYVEVPGGSHVSVAEPAFAPMMDFFAKQSKNNTSGSGGTR